MSSLPAEVDFTANPAATSARMDQAMAFLVAWLRRVESVQPEFLAVTEQLKAVGLSRLDAVLSPIFLDAQDISDKLTAIRAAWLTGQPFTQLIADLTAQVTDRLTTVDRKLSDVEAHLAANLASVTSQLGNNSAAVTAQLAANATNVGNQLTAQNAAVDGKLAELSPTAKWAAATADEARAATASRLISAAILWAMQEPVPLADAAVIPLDLSKGVHFTTTPLGGNRTLAAPMGGKPGQEGFIRVVQDGAGGRTLSFAAAYRFPDLATAPSLNAGAGAVTLLRYHVSATGEVFISGGKPGSSTPTAGYTPGWSYGSPRSLQFNQSYTLQGGTVLFQPLVITKAVTISRLGVTVANSNISNMRLGLYDSVAGKPNALLTQTAMFATNSGYAPAPQNCPTITVQPGVYWIAIGGDNTWSAQCTNSDPAMVSIVGIRPSFTEGGMPLLSGQGSVGTNGLPAVYSTANGVDYMMTIYNIWFVAS